MFNAYANRVGKCRENYSLMIPFILRCRRRKKNIAPDNENVDLMVPTSDGTRRARVKENWSENNFKFATAVDVNKCFKLPISL